jgi:wyosine [tRNA(Phe)-imidazoG37] synthetase (radical SAM superfamily)
MGLLALQSDIIYGPINSRRLGRSLGVNLLPIDYKLCSFDCIYCQYGRTLVKTLSPEAERFPDFESILQAIEKALQAHQQIDYLTFSGNGEPTLHPQFPAIVESARELLRRYQPHAKLALLSNSTTVSYPEIREAILRLDAPIMHLDAGDPHTLARINRHAPGVKFDEIVAGLKEIPQLIVQSVLINGDVSNIHGEPYEAWIATLADVIPKQVQIYSTERPVTESGIQCVPPAALERIAVEVQERTGIIVRAYWAQKG